MFFFLMFIFCLVYFFYASYDIFFVKVPIQHVFFLPFFIFVHDLHKQNVDLYQMKS